jgi:anaerobic magnesium-protoporphyrin IX monomethyl ester cyclase
VIVNPRRPYILDLDELPLPARDLIDVDQYLDTWRQRNGYASLTISVARGCPYGCRWCQDAVHGPELRQRSPQGVVAEVKALMARYDIDRLRLVDDVDGIERDWLEAWAECAQAEGAVLPFEALNDLGRQDIPMLDVRDTL